MPMLSRISRRAGALPRYARGLATADLPLTRLFINGERRAAADGRAYDVVNPADNRVVSRGANAGTADCTAAVDAAAAAQPAWEKSSFAQRSAVLLRAADFLEGARARIAETLGAETGATPGWAAFQTHGAVSTLRTAAAMAGELGGRTYPSALVPGAHVIEQRRALGVVFSISPWNAPSVLATRAVALPLLCGNAVVLKGSEHTPATIDIVVEAFAEVRVSAS
jgi:acyl-CoA reductase-like NAD-dependent aldehyde dehydrogenase